MKLKDEQGSILLESVLILPIFVLIIFFIIQITFVWTAKQMTYYAAYCGARAALVYNPADYYAEKQENGSWKTQGFIRKGIVHQAACAVLSWISWSISGHDLSLGANRYFQNAEFLNFKVGTYAVPLSSNIRNQVSVKVSEFEELKGEKSDDQVTIHEQFPAVTVTVAFKCPLFIPLGGMVVAYFFGANDGKCEPTYKYDAGKKVFTRDAIGVGGFTAYNGRVIHNHLESRGNYVKTKAQSYYTMVLMESCTMAKPYKTDTFPLMPQRDKALMGMVE